VKYRICQECIWSHGRASDVCDTCDQGDQFDPVEPDAESWHEPDDTLSLGAGKRVHRIVGAT
jgi:hypothetical protein